MFTMIYLKQGDLPWGIRNTLSFPITRLRKLKTTIDQLCYNLPCNIFINNFLENFQNLIRYVFELKSEPDY